MELEKVRARFMKYDSRFPLLGARLTPHTHPDKLHKEHLLLTERLKTFEPSWTGAEIREFVVAESGQVNLFRLDNTPIISFVIDVIRHLIRLTLFLGIGGFNSFVWLVLDDHGPIL